MFQDIDYSVEDVLAQNRYHYYVSWSVYYNSNLWTVCMPLGASEVFKEPV